ncbi:MAG: hypothetical protein ABSA93_19260 [Streptosporangiaceae bacterium]|jgi:hypothetical protein
MIAGHPDDGEILEAIKDLVEAIDPMPADLPERIRFGLTLRNLEAEMARVPSAGHDSVLAVRGTEGSRTVTFDSDSLTIMIRIDANADGTARVDGWLAPPRSSQVEMRLADTSITVTADELGRFVFGGVPRGTARLIVRPSEAGGTGADRGSPARPATSMSTPPLTLLASE